ncbi:MAG: zinc ribbon domain-containing protein [Myxococcota bacterium]|nr:zinc ribbon domain-containing protein [Myxococcota bacterium]
MAAGIRSYGAYVPPTRLPLAALSGAPVKPDAEGPEKAVAWNDEDAITMAVEAAVNCLRGFDRASVDGLLFASTTYAFQEKQAAALVARALDLPRSVRTADYAGSLRAGTGALRGAADAVAAGTARNVLVVVSDCRLGAPGSGLERSGGDGAAALLVGADDPIATIDDYCTVTDEIVDVWRSSADRFVHSWEDRFVVQEGYTPAVLEAVKSLLEKSGGPFAHVALQAPDARSHAGVARALRIERDALVDPLLGRVGNAGCAMAPLLLAAALEAARPGERLLVASQGDGAEALALSATAQIEKLDSRRGVSWHLARRRPVLRYDKYLKARGLGTTEWQAGGDPGLSATVHFRERDEDVSLIGQKCRACGAVQFPKQRLCESCFAKDDSTPWRLSDRVGTVVTYTFDFFFPTPDPPTVVTITDVDGARLHVQLVDADPKAVRTGLPVEFTFRRIHEVGGRPNYYWKARPLPEDGA